MMERLNLKKRFLEGREMSPEDKRRRTREFFINNSLYILLIIAIIGIEIYDPRL